MIITRTPLRITLGGGGTDIPEYYQKNGGFWISATIDKYVYVALNNRFEKELRIVYSKLENHYGYLDIEHPIIRELFKKYSIWQNQEFVTFADLPGRSGLGSSGSFTVGAIKAFEPTIDRINLAEQAYNIERVKLNRSIGKQDQYSASFGGIRSYKIDTDGKITDTIIVNPKLEDHLMLIYTSNIRDSEKMLNIVKESEDQLKQIEDLGIKSAVALLSLNYQKFGELVDEHWQIKKTISPEMSTPEIDTTIENLKNSGAIGAKLIGAGSGGFILAVIPDKETKLRIQQSSYLDHKTLVPFKFTYTGSEVIASDS